MSMKRHQRSQYDENKLVFPIRHLAMQCRLCWLQRHDRRSHLLWMRILVNFGFVLGIDVDAFYETTLTHRMINRFMHSHQMMFYYLCRLQWILPGTIVQMPCSCECCPLLFYEKKRKQKLTFNFSHGKPNLNHGRLFDYHSNVTIFGIIIPEHVSISTFCKRNAPIDFN